MPRVYTKTAATRKYSRRDKQIPRDAALGDLKPNFTCVMCGLDIAPKTSYYEWGFRFGGTFRQHVSCGYPRRGQLTQSKMATVYDAADDALDQIDSAEEYEDIYSILEELSSVVEDVANEYEEAADAFGGAGDNADRAADLQGWASDLMSAIDYLDETAPACDNEMATPAVPLEDCASCADAREQWLSDLREAARSEIDNCPI